MKSGYLGPEKEEAGRVFLGFCAGLNGQDKGLLPEEARAGQELRGGGPEVAPPKGMTMEQRTRPPAAWLQSSRLNTKPTSPPLQCWA